MKKKFSGVFTALITPFKKDLSIDFTALEKLIEKQITSGIDGIVALGTTGESPTISHQDHSEVIKFIINKVAKRCLVIAGTGSNCTEEALFYSKKAQKDGADALLQVVPYYNKPTQKGLLEHFKLLAEKVDLPQIIYNIKGRCAVNLANETLFQLAKLPNIIGVKESSGDINQMMDVLQNCPQLTVLSGDDNFTFPLLSLGGNGVVSVLSNFLPLEVKSMVDAFFAGDFLKAQKIHFELLPKMKACFLETNPIPIKTLHALKGECENIFRLPLCPANESTVKKLREVFNES